LGTTIAMVFGPPRVDSDFPYAAMQIVFALQWAIVAFTGYVALLPLAGFWTRRARRLLPPRNRFAIVVPAHDERQVVGHLVDSCRALDYPRNLYDIYVVADNCRDDTAAVARRQGARVLVRTDPSNRGKGHALEFAFRHLLAARRPYDAVVVLDADNLVSPGFLRVMNTYLLSGHAVVQGRMDVKNPNDTWVTATFGMSVWVSNRFWYLAKHNLGLSAELGGTGMCIRTDVLRALGWGATSLTEDLEFSMKALANGIRTAWAHDAVVYDEKPLTFHASWRQRTRWVQGQVQVALQYLPPLLWRLIRHRDFACIEGVLQLLQPFYVASVSLMAVLGLVTAHQLIWDPILRHVLFTPAWTAFCAAQYLLPAAAIAYDRRSWRTARYIFLYPLFQYSWVPLTWVGLLTFRNRRWTHTEHTRSLTLSDLPQGGRG
jgi:cellulose synthase/poly-beta-1,6-N-acetylglucosamine synthase-like glycosyltransferase